MEQILRRSQLGAGIDPQSLRLGAAHNRRFQPLRPGNFHDVGQVIFALGIMRRDLIQQAEQALRIGCHHTAIAKGDCTGRCICVLVFDNRLKAVARHHHPAIAGRINRFEAQKYHIAPGPGVQHGLQCGLGHERGVAIQHNDIAVKPGQRITRGQHRVARAQLFGLHRNPRIRVPVQRGLGYLIGPDTHHHDHPLRREHRAGFHRMDQQRRARQLVQDLGPFGIHPRALTCRQNDQTYRHRCAPPFLGPLLVLTTTYRKPWGFTSPYMALQDTHENRDL